MIPYYRSNRTDELIHTATNQFASLTIELQTIIIIEIAAIQSMSEAN